MPLRDSAPLGARYWIELFSSDTARAVDFCGDLFGGLAQAADPTCASFRIISGGPQ